MSITAQIKNKIRTYPRNKLLTFGEIRNKLDKDINTNSFRQAMHRLHKQGVITLKDNGHFIKEDQFKIYLFVYGSLKKGFNNHHILFDANYISKASTIGKFAMFTETDKNYPYIIKDERIGQRIDGELYEITRKDVLDKIDTFEGAPFYFQRKDVMIKTRSKKLKAKTYVLANPKVPLEQKPLKSWQKNKIIKEKFDFKSYYENNIAG